MVLVAGAELLVAQDPAKPPAPAGGAHRSEAAAKKAFATNCSGCHGQDATGGDRGPSISAGSNAAKLTDAELKRTIRNGIAGSGMPPFASLGNAQIASIASYLRDLQGKARGMRVPGDPQRGASLFSGKAECSRCHMAAGKGGFIASDLTGYGENRSPAEIRRAITDPGNLSQDAAKLATVQMSDGTKYTGVVRTEDNFSLALQTLDGTFLLIHKSDVVSISYTPDTLMPKNYGTTLTSRELDDLVSYLMRLQRKMDPSAAPDKPRGGWEDAD
jgi:cytochrome c oxidase cbb3-type subunit 3